MSASLQFSEELLAALQVSPEELTGRLRLAAAMKWYAEGAISQEIAAQVAGLNRVDFLLALAKHRQPSFHVDFEELKNEISRG